jgi:hypothetical protein
LLLLSSCHALLHLVLCTHQCVAAILNAASAAAVAGAVAAIVEAVAAVAADGRLHFPARMLLLPADMHLPL